VERWARAEGSAFVSVPEIGWHEFGSSLGNGDDDDDCGGKTLTHKEKLEKLAVDRLGFIFSTYHIRAWWYELADLLRKLALVGAVNFVPTAGGTQLLVALAICFTFIVLNCVLSPDVDEIVDRFTLMALFQLYLTLIVGLALKMREEQEEEQEEEFSDNVIGVVLLVLDLLIFVTPVCMLLWLFTAPYVPKIQQVGKQAVDLANGVFLKSLAAWRQRTRQLQETAARRMSHSASMSSSSTLLQIKENPLFAIIERSKLALPGHQTNGDGAAPEGGKADAPRAFELAQFADSPAVKVDENPKLDIYDDSDDEDCGIENLSKTPSRKRRSSLLMSPEGSALDSLACSLGGVENPLFRLTMDSTSAHSQTMHEGTHTNTNK
ncbi:hypothetical protein CYMTET_44443, partial [Cymbomonas tetramitiformis]